MAEIIVKGKPLPIHFGMKAITEYTKRSNRDFHDVITSTESLSSIETLADITVMGLNEGARRCRPAHGDNSSDGNRRYTTDDVWDMFDDEPNLILKVSEIFIESITPMINKLGSLSPNAVPTAVEKPSA